MGIFSKLAFWKKAGSAMDDPFASSPNPFPDQSGLNQSMAPGMDQFGQGMQQGMQGMNPQGYDPYAPIQDQTQQSNAPFSAGPGSVPLGQFGGQGGQPQYQDAQMGQSLGATHLDKDLQIISLKLDTIKSELDVMKNRLEKIEKIAENESSKTKKIEYGW